MLLPLKEREMLRLYSTLWEFFPGETFRALKDKERRAYGEYHTRHRVLEAWERMI